VRLERRLFKLDTFYDGLPSLSQHHNTFLYCCFYFNAIFSLCILFWTKKWYNCISVRSVGLFGEAVGSPLLPQNAHVLSMMGTINFLLHNFVRAATMYETSHVLRQHLQGVPEDPTLEMPWTQCMLSLSYFSLGHYHKCIMWCLRAFTLYVRLYGGRILDVDAVGHWFIVQTLYMLGFAYHSLRLDDKGMVRNLA